MRSSHQNSITRIKYPERKVQNGKHQHVKETTQIDYKVTQGAHRNSKTTPKSLKLAHRVPDIQWRYN